MTSLTSCGGAIEDNLHSLGVEQLAAVNLRLMDDTTPDLRFDDQLAAMTQARDEGLIGGVGLSNVTLEHLLRALERTEVTCVQNPLNLINRASMPVLDECNSRGIAFVPFFPLGSGFARTNPVVGNEHVISNAERLGITPAQVALAWTLGLAPNVLLIHVLRGTWRRTSPPPTSSSTRTRSSSWQRPQGSGTAALASAGASSALRNGPPGSGQGVQEAG